MKFPGFLDGSFPAQSITADSQRAVNVYPELLGQNWTLYRRAGLSPAPFATLTGAPVRGLFFENGRLFGVGGGRFCEVTSIGQVIDYGPVGVGGGFVSFASNGVAGHQILVISAGGGYLFDINTNTLTPITVANFPNATSFPAAATMAVFIDGYFCVFATNTNQFNLSGLFDGTTYSGLDVAQRESASDTMVAIASNHRELWLYGNRRTEVWVNVGAANFPFAPFSGAFIEQGAIPWTIVALDNTLFWVGQDANGQGIGWRAQGYTPMRVSNAAVEATWQRYPTIQDAESFTEQVLGHPAWVVNFPTAQATWAYDVSTTKWHERDFWNVQTGQFEAARARCHVSVWGGLHLVGDRASGNLYVQDAKYLDDFGNVIRCRRRAPHFKADKKRIFVSRFELACQIGDGLPNPQTNPPTAPKATLRVSRDGGRTFGPDRTTSLGIPGQYDARAEWWKVAQGRDLVFEVEIADRVPVAMVDAYLDATPGLS